MEIRKYLELSDNKKLYTNICKKIIYQYFIPMIYIHTERHITCLMYIYLMCICIYIVCKMQKELLGEKFISLNVHISKKKSKNWESKHLVQEVTVGNVIEIENLYKSYGILPTFHPETRRLNSQVGILVF